MCLEDEGELMVNKPKAIGTRDETATARFFVQQGIPGVEPRRTHGRYDLGDLVGIPDTVVEVKGGRAAERASDGQIQAWLNETVTEQYNAHVMMGLLVTKRAGYGSQRVGYWRAHMYTAMMCTLVDAVIPSDVYALGVMSTDVHTAVELLRGWLIRTGQLTDSSNG